MFTLVRSHLLPAEVVNEQLGASPAACPSRPADFSKNPQSHSWSVVTTKNSLYEPLVAPWLVVLGVRDQRQVVPAARPAAPTARFSMAHTTGAVSAHPETA